jgi:hypothetical protein
VRVRRLGDVLTDARAQPSERLLVQTDEQRLRAPARREPEDRQQRKAQRHRIERCRVARERIVDRRNQRRAAQARENGARHRQREPPARREDQLAQQVGAPGRRFLAHARGRINDVDFHFRQTS